MSSFTTSPGWWSRRRSKRLLDEEEVEEGESVALSARAFRSDSVAGGFLDRKREKGSDRFKLKYESSSLFMFPLKPVSLFPM